MFNKAVLLLFATALASIAVAQELQFTSFLLNLTLHTGESVSFTWQGQDSYVNITLAQFYYFGGGSDYKGIITTFNNGNSFTWAPDASLQQGVYAFFMTSPNRNSSESPFFAILTTNASVGTSPSPSSSASCSSASSPSGLSDAAKVGIGVGVPLGLIIIACVSFIFWREKSGHLSRGAANHGRHSLQTQHQTITELEAKRPVYELRAQE